MGAYQLSSGFGGESTCLSFDAYMQAAELVRQNDPRVDTILLTSEDPRFVEARHNYSGGHGGSGWRFVTNPTDVMQATGAAARLAEQHGMDAVVLSFLSSLHLQMRAQYLLLNCASNFHDLLRLLVLEGGCGWTRRRPVAICLDRQPLDRPYRICVGWDKDFEQCRQRRGGAPPPDQQEEDPQAAAAAATG